MSRQKQSLGVLNRMEDCELGLRVELGQEQEKGNVGLKVAAWALCKESNVASGKNVVSPLSAAGPEKGLQSEALKIDHDVQETLGSSCKECDASGKELNIVSSLCKKELKSEELETDNDTQKTVLASGPGSTKGLKRKPSVCCEEQDLMRKKVKTEMKLTNSLGEVVALKLEHKSVIEDRKVKKEVQLGDLNIEECEEENDEMNMNMGTTPNAEHVQKIIAGRKNISFDCFKKLMEDGHLKKKDLVLMKSARVVQVPGKGEVVQFLSSSEKQFNKINLKKLGLNDVKEVWPMTKKARYLAQTQLPGFISGLISKKGSTFRCNTCETVHADAATVRSHITTKHADMLVKSGAYEDPRSDERLISTAIAQLLRRMCNPSLLIEQVVITNNTLKQLRKMDSDKNHQINIYQRAADLLIALIQPGRAPGPGWGNMVYHCKPCGVNTSSSNWRKNDRWGCVWHLAYAHTADYQNLAARLNVAPGPGLDNLLFQALAPGLIFNAKKPH